VHARVRDGLWLRARRGAYVDAPPPGTLRHDADRLLALARLTAIRDQLTTSVVVSHASAALLWGLPIVGLPRRPHVTIPYNPSGGPRRDIVRHVRALPERHATPLLGFTITTLERTVVDCAMALGPRAGLVIADAALRLGADRDECRGILATLAGHRGVVAARAVVDLADDGAESAGESIARFVLLRAGLPTPETQVRVSTHLGTFWADLGWPAWRLLAEYDGRAKYEAKGSAAAAVIEEKRRQDAIEETGNRVLRITKEDVVRPERLVARVLRLAPSGSSTRLRPRAALTACAPRSANSREIAPS